MGQRFSISFKGCTACFGKREIISDQSLEAIREIVLALRSNVQVIGHAWLLRVGGAVHQGVVQELFTAIKKGDPDTVRSMLDAGWRIEASQALYMYLARLPDPLIPVSIQRLVLDDAGNVPVEVVALDVIGLMKQELPSKQLQLASELLHLLDTVIKFSPADELRGNTLPISMLPLFFNIDTQHINEWRRIATIFVELIRQASHQLESSITTNVRTNYRHPSTERLMRALYQPPEDIGNDVVRRCLVPAAFRGDSRSVEVYRSNQNRRT